MPDINNMSASAANTWGQSSYGQAAGQQDNPLFRALSQTPAGNALIQYWTSAQGQGALKSFMEKNGGANALMGDNWQKTLGSAQSVMSSFQKQPGESDETYHARMESTAPGFAQWAANTTAPSWDGKGGTLLDQIGGQGASAAIKNMQARGNEDQAALQHETEQRRSGQDLMRSRANELLGQLDPNDPQSMRIRQAIQNSVSSSSGGAGLGAGGYSNNLSGQQQMNALQGQYMQRQQLGAQMLGQSQSGLAGQQAFNAGQNQFGQQMGLARDQFNYGVGQQNQANAAGMGGGIGSTIGGVGGAILGGLAGGPAGAMAGGMAGSAIGGGVGRLAGGASYSPSNTGLSKGTSGAW